MTATGVNKVFDGTTAATVILSDNRVSVDVFTDSYTAASFSDPNIGFGKPVSVSGISLSGLDAGNYTFNTTASTTADITVRATSTSLASSLNITVTPMRVDLTATVTSGGPTPIGTVTFTDSVADVLGTTGLSAGGVATVSTTTLSLGQHIITATYNPGSRQFHLWMVKSAIEKAAVGETRSTSVVELAG